ncbi:sulfatase-like hydrolase/transferase [Pontiella sulfatireligans]|uniref:Arylsulfatase n=1 Tax=Pontiella sulfatireligans TaxID=2750658 RepID=A0A6C2UWL6_9BACT|nr:sulfatase-like hydrolase/transferase [Pontiella sulfatireligans]SPS74574.1 sulfatase S1_16 [Kiritimatiellales bacterium]VGO23507.1 Arylsulfatase [Pontiella sulfatireligans]
MKTLNKTIMSILFGLLLSTSFAAQNKPNIVMLYIDDWAWNGSPIPMNDSMENSFMPILEMPNLDKLAGQGMKFTHAYGAHQCAPARASLQTGQSGARTGFTLVSGKPNGKYYDTRPMYQNLPLIPNVSDASLDADAITIPEVLKPLGYTSAHLGKWHQYSDPGAEGYVLHDGDTNNDPGNTVGKVQRLPEDLTDPKLMFSTTEKAIGFMEDQVGAGNPFYLQVSYYAMHEGRECLAETRKKYARHPLVQAYYKKVGQPADNINRKKDPAVWLGMGENLDGRIGAVLDEIKKLGIEKNTYVIVVSDNGYRHEALELTPGKKQPLHGHKWWVWQGGIRVPMIVKGPGIKGGSVFEGNVINYDFMPTFYDWAGGDPKDLKDIDGVSLAGFMAGKKPDETFLNRNLYFHVPHYREEVPHSAIVSGSYKVMHFYERPDIPMLFDLSKDPGEVNNVAKQYPETHKRLFGEMMTYLQDVDARFPKANPDYDPEVYKKLKNYNKYIKWGPFEGKRPLEEDEL